MIERIIAWLMVWCIKNGRVLNISGTAEPEDVYLIRYVLARNRFFSIYIHQFLRSDRDDLHDHPWNFATFLVRGAYTEHKWNPKKKQVESTTRTTKKNRFVFRKATDQHRIIVDKDLKPEEKDQAALTLFFSGPVIREWGFIVNEEILDDVVITNKVGKSVKLRHVKRVKRNWIDWRKYLGLPPDHPSR